MVYGYIMWGLIGVAMKYSADISHLINHPSEEIMHNHNPKQIG